MNTGTGGNLVRLPTILRLGHPNDLRRNQAFRLFPDIVTMVLVMAILAIISITDVRSGLVCFSLVLAVGLTPQLLPVIISITFLTREKDGRKKSDYQASGIPLKTLAA